MKKSLVCFLTVFLMFCVSGVANATTFENETFDAGWTMGTEWTADRVLPGVVESATFDGDSRLHFGIEAENQGEGWSDFKGIKHEVDMPEWSYQSFSIDLYLNADWGTIDANAGLWGQAQDADGNISGWPILVYRNSDSVTAGFYSYDYLEDPDYGWDLFLATDSDDYGSWHNLSFTLTRGSGVEYFVNGTSLGTFVDTNTADLSHVILNAFNYGEDEDVYFDNFKAIATPEPATLLLFGLGLLGVAGVSRRRK